MYVKDVKQSPCGGGTPSSWIGTLKYRQTNNWMVGSLILEWPSQSLNLNAIINLQKDKNKVWRKKNSSIIHKY